MEHVERRRLDPRLERVVAGQRILLEQIARSTPLDAVLDQLVALVERYASDGAVGCVLVRDAATGALRVGAAPRMPQAYRDLVGTLSARLDGSAREETLRQGSVVTADVATDPRWQPVREVVLAGGLRSCWMTTLWSGEVLLGTFSVFFPHQREPDRQDRAAAEMISATATLAIDRHHVELSRRAALERLEASQEDLQFVLRATTALAGSLEQAETVRTLAELAVQRLAPLAAVDLVVGDRVRRVAVAVRQGVPDEVRQAVADHDPRPGSDHPTVRVLATQAEEVVLAQEGWVPEDVRRDGDHVAALDRIGATGYACFPLTAAGRTFGVLSIAATVDEPLQERVIRLARELAERGGLAVDNAHQHARRREGARQLADLNDRLTEAAEAQRQVALSLQRAMLPAPPRRAAGLDVAVRYRPADDGLAIGGDWFDVLAGEGSATQVSFAVGDVVGKGLSAAGVMGQLRSALRTASWSADGPAAALHVVDQYARTLDGAFGATVVKVRVDVAAGILRYACAGHPPPLLVGPDGAFTYLTGATRPPLCVDGGGRYVEASAPFPPGSLLVLYSDGLVERRDRDIDLGLEWLGALVGEHLTLGAEEMADLVLTASVAGGPAEDDTAVVVVRSPA